MSKYSRDDWYSGTTRTQRVSAIIDDIDARLTALEQGKHEAVTIDRYALVQLLVKYKTCELTLREMVTELERRIETAKPAEPTSEPDEVVVTREFWRMATKLMNEPPEPTSDRLFYAVPRDDIDYNDYIPATRAQVEAEARRMGLLDTPRQKVAEAFLHAALDDLMGGQETYQETSELLIRLSRTGNVNYRWFEGMAAVLQNAASDQEARK